LIQTQKRRHFLTFIPTLPFWHDLGQFLPNKVIFGRIRSIFGRVGSILAELGQFLAVLGQFFFDYLGKKVLTFNKPKKNLPPNFFS